MRTIRGRGSIFLHNLFLTDEAFELIIINILNRVAAE